METLDEILHEIVQVKKLRDADPQPPFDIIGKCLVRLRELEGKRDKLIAERDGKICLVLHAHTAAQPIETVSVEFHVFGMKKDNLFSEVFRKSVTFAEFKRIFSEIIASTPSAKHVQAADILFRTRDKQDLIDDATLHVALRGGGRVHVDVVSGARKFASADLCRSEAVLQAHRRGYQKAHRSEGEVQARYNFEIHGVLTIRQICCDSGN